MIWEIQYAQAVQAGRSVYEEIQRQRAKSCVAEKGRIEGENAARLENASFDNVMELGSCEALIDTGWSFGA